MNLNEEVEILKGVPIFSKIEPAKLKLAVLAGQLRGEDRRDRGLGPGGVGDGRDSGLPERGTRQVHPAELLGRQGLPRPVVGRHVGLRPHLRPVRVHAPARGTGIA